jgi:hypothetical protein
MRCAVIDSVPGNPPFRRCHHINEQFLCNISLVSVAIVAYLSERVYREGSPL